MAVYNKGTHLSFSDRQIIEKGIINDSTKSAIAAILGKDKSTIGKEIKTHLVRKHHCSYPVECALFSKCTIVKIIPVILPVPSTKHFTVREETVLLVHVTAVLNPAVAGMTSTIIMPSRLNRNIVMSSLVQESELTLP